MDFLTFREKLSALNKNLYVDINNKTYAINTIYGTSGIYLRNHKREYISELDTPAQHLQDVRIWNDQADTCVGWVTHGWVPEGDKFVGNTCIARGWRTIVKNLVNEGYTTASKARLVFGWEPSDYDLLTYEQKVRFECQHRAQGTLEMN